MLLVSTWENGNLALADLHGLADVDSGYWQIQVTPPIGESISVLSVVDMNTCWMGGDSGKVIRTTDGGNSWLQMTVGFSDSVDFSALDAVSEDLAFAGLTHSDTSYIFRTTNGGLSWDIVYSQATGHIDGIKMYDESRGIAVGDPVGGTWTVARTSNSGSTWTRVINEPRQVSGRMGGNGFGTFDTTNIWFFDKMGGGYQSYDGGASWISPADSAPLGGGTHFIWMNGGKHEYSILWISGSNIFGNNGFGYVLMGSTPDLFLPVTGLVGATSTTEFWFVQGIIYYVPDFCYQCYTISAPNGLDKPAKLIDMVTAGTEISAWATGIRDTVYHYSRITTAAADHPQSAPKAFALSQSYPNPFNPSTKIKYDLPTSSRVLIKIYNLLGQTVTTLTAGMQQPGEQSVQWNAAGFSSGVYFYKLEATSLDKPVKTFTQVRKMVLMK